MPLRGRTGLTSLRLVMRRRRRIVMITFVGILVSAFLYANLQRPVYKAACSIQILESSNLNGMLRGITLQTSPESLHARAQEMQSYRILTRTMRELNLVGKNATPDQAGRAVLKLQQSVKVRALEGTNVIVIEVVQDNPQRARDIANRIAIVYVDETVRERRSELETFREFVEKQIEQASASLSETEARVRKVQEEGMAWISGAMKQRLTDLVLERDKLARQAPPSDPGLAGLNREIEQVSASLKEHLGRELEMDRLSRELEMSQKTYLDLRKRLEETKISEAAQVPDAALMDFSSVPAMPIAPKRWLQLVVALGAASLLALAGGLVAENLDISFRTVEELEANTGISVLGTIPYSPPGAPEQLNRAKGVEKEIEAIRQRLLFNLSPESQQVESFRIVAAELGGGSPETTLKGKSFLITSARRGEGKTMVCLNLALTLAREGLRVLVVDADFRRATFHHILGIARSPGLTELLLGSATVEAAIRTGMDLIVAPGFKAAAKTPGVDLLSFLTTGLLAANASDLLGSEVMGELLSKFKSDHDVVLLDSPPVLSVAESIELAPQVDGVILVYGAGLTPQAALLRSKVQLETVGARLRGVVLSYGRSGLLLPEDYYRYYRTSKA